MHRRNGYNRFKQNGEEKWKNQNFWQTHGMRPADERTTVLKRTLYYEKNNRWLKLRLVCQRCNCNFQPNVIKGNTKSSANSPISYSKSI